MNGFLNILAEYYGAAGVFGPEPDGGAVQAAAAGDVFGPLSQRAAEAGHTAVLAGGLSSTTLFHAVTVLLLICYVLVLYRNPELLKTLREHIFSPGAGRNEHMNESRSDALRGFSWGGVLLDTLFVCTAAVRLTDTLMPEAAAAVPEAARMLAIPLAAGVFFVTAAYQHTLLALTGAVTVSQPLTSSLNHIRAIYFRLATVTQTPILLLWALTPAEEGRAFEIIMILQAAFILLAALRETFLLFISKKLSIYHWFLYLCAVEAFPLSLICLLAVRGLPFDIW